MCVEYITDFDGVGIYSIPSIQLSYLSIFETISIFGNIGPEKLKKPRSCLPYKNKLFVSDSGNHCITAFDKSGTFLHKFGKEGNQDGQVNCPSGLLIDSSNYLLL